MNIVAPLNLYFYIQLTYSTILTIFQSIKKNKMTIWKYRTDNLPIAINRIIIDAFHPNNNTMNPELGI